MHIIYDGQILSMWIHFTSQKTWFWMKMHVIGWHIVFGGRPPLSKKMKKFMKTPMSARGRCMAAKGRCMLCIKKEKIYEKHLCHLEVDAWQLDVDAWQLEVDAYCASSSSSWKIKFKHQWKKLCFHI